MKSVMLSTQPKWCEPIANGKKTIEVRKTRPKIGTPFKCYIYCTKGVDNLWIADRKVFEFAVKIAYIFTAKWAYGFNKVNGKVIGEFVCDGVLEIDQPYLTWLEERTCVDMNHLATYKGERDVIYGWHITDLAIYDKPKDLAEFGISRPPQSWCYVGRKEQNNG